MTAIPQQLPPMPSQPRVPPWAANLALLALVAAFYPTAGLMESRLDPYFYRILILIGLNILLAVSLNLINGITGQFSLGHAGFMAVGAYVTGVALKQYHPAGIAAQTALYVAMLILAGAGAALAGLIVGIPCLRLRGDYLAIATLGFGEIINVVIVNTESIGRFYVGGSSGLHGIPIWANFFWVYAAVVLCVVVVWRLAYSSKGKAFAAIRDDEIAATAMGVDTTYYKVAAFAIGAFFAGMAGGLYATYDGNLDPDSFKFMRSFEIVTMVVLGGSGSITGAILAAALLTCLPEGLRFIDSATGGVVDLKNYRLIIYSLLLIFMMLFRPTGLMGSRELFPTRLGRRVLITDKHR